jgi:hypothetical protein
MDFLKVTIGSSLVFSLLGLTGWVVWSNGHGQAVADGNFRGGPADQIQESAVARARLRVLTPSLQAGLNIRGINDNSVLETMLKGGLKECEKVYGTGSVEVIQARFALLRLYQEQRRWSESESYLKAQVDAFSKLKREEQLPLAPRYLEEGRTYLGRDRGEDAALLIGVVFGVLEQNPQLALDRQFRAPLQDCTRLFEARHKWSEAEELHRHLLAILNKCQPLDEQALAFEELALGEILLAQRRFSAALELAQLAGQRGGGDNFAALALEAKVLLEQGRLKEAAVLLPKIESGWRPGSKVSASNFADGYLQSYHVERQELEMLASKFISGDDFKSATRLWFLMLERAREKPNDLIGVLDVVYRAQAGLTTHGGNEELEAFYSGVLAKYPSFEVREKVAQNRAWMYISLGDSEKFIAAFKALIKLSTAAKAPDSIESEGGAMSPSRGFISAGKRPNFIRLLDAAGKILTARQYHDLSGLLLKESPGLNAEAKARELSKICARYLLEPAEITFAKQVFQEEVSLFKSSLNPVYRDLAQESEKLFTIYLENQNYREASSLASSMANYGFNPKLEISVVNGYLQVSRMYEAQGDISTAEKLVSRALSVIETTQGKNCHAYLNALSSQVRLLRIEGRTKEAGLAELERLKLKENLKDQASTSFCD